MLLSHFGHSGFPFHLLDVNIGTVIHLYMLWNRMREEKPKNMYTLLFFFSLLLGARCQFYQLNLLTLSNEHDFLWTKMHNSHNGGSLPTFCCWQNLFLIEKQKKIKIKLKKLCVFYITTKARLRCLFFLLVRCVNVYNTHSALTQYTIAI